MGKKLYTFKCGCQAEEPKIIKAIVHSRFCPNCYDAQKEYTAQAKCRIKSLEFECEQCGKHQERASGATQVFLCRECQYERQQEKIRQKLAEKRAQAQQEREREEQERQRLEQERLAHIKKIERENAELKAKLASLKANPPAPTPAPVETVKTPKQGGTKKAKAKCPRCEIEHTVKANMEFNTRTTRWLFCPACAPMAKNSGISEAGFDSYI